MLFSLLLLSSSSLSLSLLCFSFVSVILELMGLKKPAFRRLFTQMTANFVRLVFKILVRHHGTQPYVETIQGFTKILLCSLLILCKLVE